MTAVTRRVKAPVNNYYGGPALVVMSDGSYRLDCEDYDGWAYDFGEPVSERFARAWLDEFDKPAKDEVK